MNHSGGDAWLGVDLGGTKMSCVVLGSGRDVVARYERATGRHDGVEPVLARVLELVGEASDGRDVRGIGVGFAGLVDTDAGRVLSSVILPGWDDVPLAERITAATGRPCVVDNDATTAGIGELLALGEPDDLCLVALTVGTGIGGAIFVDGRLHRGRLGTAAELGHMTIDWDGERCWCDNVGCLHTLASGSAISEHAARFAADEPESALAGLATPIPVQRIAEEAARGDLAARRAIDLGARALGAGIANVVNVLAPDRISLSGGVAQLGDDYLRTVRDEARRRAFAEPFAAVEIAPATLGVDTGAIGAALLARRSVSGRPL